MGKQRMTNDYYEKEIRNIELQRKGMRDQYNSLDNPYDMHDVEKVTRSDLEYAPNEGETLSSYYQRAKIYVKLTEKKNIQTHINGPKGAWYTHRNPSGCFACEDLNILNVLLRTLDIIQQKYPETKL